MHSNLTGNMPYLLPNVFQRNSQLLNHATRSLTDIYVPMAKTNSRKSAFSLCGPKIWNSLPSTLKNITSLYTFKIELKESFLSGYLSS